MKLPLSNSGSGGSNSFHMYNDSPEPDERELDHELDVTSENSEIDFTEYLWMEDEEEFDKLEMNRLEEEALAEECMESMQNDDNDELALDLLISMTSEETFRIMDLYVIENSKLNPLAKEFVPSSMPKNNK